MCVHERARRAIDLPSWPAHWTAALGTTLGQHHWPALLTPLASRTGRHNWSEPLAGIIGQDPWHRVPNTSMMTTMFIMMIMTRMMLMLLMLMVRMVVMVMNGDDELTIHSNMRAHECACRAIKWPSWPANRTATLGSITGHHY